MLTDIIILAAGFVAGALFGLLVAALLAAARGNIDETQQQ